VSGGRLSHGAANALGHSLHPHDILLMEDDRATREALCQVLSDEGYDVDAAPDGDAGLDALQRGSYRLLLLDLVMPQLDGMNVLRVLRDQPRLRPAVVAVLSARHNCDDIRTALAAGADDYLTKPFDLDDLLLHIQLWLKHVDHGADSRPSLHGSRRSAEAHGLRVFTLGHFRVEHDGAAQLRDGGRARKAATLFKYLLTHQERSVPTGEVLELLWPETPDESAATDLRSLLYQLRQLLGAPASGSSGLVHSSSTLALRLGSEDWWDAAAFVAALAEGERCLRRAESEAALEAYSMGIALYAGDYLAADAYADWAQPLREHLRDQWLHGLTALSDLHGTLGHPREQEGVLRTLLRADPYREESQRALMTLLAEQGRGAEALVLYRQLQQRLRTEFDAHPDPKTAMLALHIGHRAAETTAAL
jgi:DNA-binding response OmpR family regulator